jgi:glucose-fructose oxidoreductase
MKKLGVALVGLGWYSENELAPALRLTQHCRLAGVVCGAAEKGRRWAAKFNFPERNVYATEELAQVADNPDIDIVYLVTPNAHHADQMITVAKARKHLICEKPITTTVADAERAIAAVKAAGIRHSVGYRLHFDPYHQELMRLARERTFGAFTRMKGDLSIVVDKKAWRTERALAGGGPIMDVGIYVIQAACMAAGGVAPVAVTAREGLKTQPDIFTDVEEAMSWTMEFADGAIAEGSTSYRAGVDFFRAEGPGGWFELGPAFAFRGLAGRTSQGPLKFDPTVNQQARQMDDFALCVLENRESRVPLELGLRDMKIIEAIYESARTGKRVAVRK